MKYDPKIHHRHSIRLKGYDYRQAGAYFVTICTLQRDCLFGEILDGEMHLNEAGEVIELTWDELPNHFPYVELDEFIAMPNHIHGIIVITRKGEAFAETSDWCTTHLSANASPLPKGPRGTRAGSLNAIVQNWKSITTRKFNQMNPNRGMRLWQRGYYEHVIRSDADLMRIREYVVNNPASWELDEMNPKFAK